MSVKVVNNIGGPMNTISANNMEPCKCYIVIDAGSTIHSINDLILTSHIGNQRRYNTIGSEI